MNGYTVAEMNQPIRPLRPYAKEQKRLFVVALLIGVGMLLQICGSSLLSTLLSYNTDIYNRYINDELFGLVIDMVYTSFCVFLPFVLVFFVMHKKGILKSLPLGSVYDPVNTSLLLFGGLGLCYVVNSIVSYLYIIMSSFGLDFYSMQQETELITLTPSILLLQVLRSAVLPALFEEFAYRGVVMQSLRRYGDWFAILVSAFLFGMIHGNMLQVPFAFLVGIILGYCTIVTGSMWCSIGIHFLNNFFALLQSVVQSAAGETAATIYLTVIMNVSMIVGAICLIVYVSRNRAFFRLRPSKFRFMMHKTSLVLCAPPVFISLGYYVYAILMDIIGFYEWFSESVGNLLYYFSNGTMY